MSDYIVRAFAEGGMVRAFAATTGDLVEEARRIHSTSPIVTAALGGNDEGQAGSSDHQD